MKPTQSSGDDRVSTLLLAGGALTAAGLALAGTIAPRTGAAILVVGWIVFGYALHRFGRANRD